MFAEHAKPTEPEVILLLRQYGIAPTAQRVLITRVLFARGTHVAAEELFRLVNANNHPHVSKATVYNTLGLLAEKGVIRSVIADPQRVFYDPNTSPHYHLYDEVSGELTDIDASQIQVTGLPSMPDDVELQGVDVIVRVRRNAGK